MAVSAEDRDTIGAAMSIIGRIKTVKKSASSRANLAKVRRTPPQKDPLALECTCGAGEVLTVGEGGHKTNCPRGRLLWQRARTAAKARREEEGSHASDQ